MSGLDPVIVLAHGSRHPLADEAVDSLARAVEGHTGRPAHAAHLDFSERTLSAVVAELAAAGARRAIVAPLLFTSAFHMKVDVPREIRQANQETGVELVLADGLGTGDDLAELIAKAHPAAKGVDSFVLYAVGSSVPGANVAVEALAQRVGGLLGAARAEAVFATGEAPAPVGADAALHSAALNSGGSGGRGGESRGYIAPLFVSPGALWDRLLERMQALPEQNSRCIRAGTHLGDAVAPLVAQRVAATG